MISVLLSTIADSAAPAHIYMAVTRGRGGLMLSPPAVDGSLVTNYDELECDLVNECLWIAKE